MKLAVVRVSGPEDNNADIVAIQRKMSEEGLECEVQNWDDPNVQWSEYALIILTSQIDYVSHVEEFLQWVTSLEDTQSPCRLRNSPKVIKWNYNKKYLLELESKGIKIPATICLDPTCTQKEDISKAIYNGLQNYECALKEVVVKNIVGADGVSVWRCKVSDDRTMDQETLDKIQQHLMSPGGRFGIMVQQYLPEIFTEGEWSMVYFDKNFSYAAIKKPAANQSTEFRIHEQYGGTLQFVPQNSVPKAILDFGNNIIAKMEEGLLYARVDVVMLAGNTPCLIELEVLDCRLYLKESAHMDRYFNVIQKYL